MPSAGKTAAKLARRVDEKPGETGNAPLMTDGSKALAAAIAKQTAEDNAHVGAAITAMNASAANRQANML